MRSRTKTALAGAGALLAMAAGAAPALAQGGDEAAPVPTPAAQATAASMNAMMGGPGMGTSGGQDVRRTHEEMMASVPGMAVMMRQNPQMARLHEKMCATSTSSAGVPPTGHPGT